MSRLQEIQARLTELKKTGNDIQREERQLINEQIDVVSEEYKQLVGRCFMTKDGKVAYRVIGTPEVKRQMTGEIEFNAHLVPAIRLMSYDIEDVPIRFLLPSLSYMNVWFCLERGLESITEEYIEISDDEFKRLVSEQVNGITSYASQHG